MASVAVAKSECSKRREIVRKLRTHKVKASVRYRCRSKLGSGAFASVYEAVDQVTGEKVAIKVAERATKNDMQYEYFIARNFQHQNLVRAHDCIRSRSQQIMLVMEFMGGGELFARIEPEYGVEEPEARGYMSDILAGLQHLHANGVVHRDIKPENVLLDAHNVAKICDFGMSEFAGQVVNVCEGTKPYLAPECVSAKRAYAVDTAHDVWSLGVLLYILLVGDFPWMEAEFGDREYARFVLSRNKKRDFFPFSNFSTELNQFFDLVLCPDPTKRGTLDDFAKVLQQPWFVESSTNEHTATAAAAAAACIKAMPTHANLALVSLSSSSSESSLPPSPCPPRAAA